MGIRVGVLGAAGRMGTATCDAVEDDEGLSLVARVGRDDDLDRLVSAGAEVAVDFTTPGSVKDNIRFCVTHGVHAVVGTTGLSAGDFEEIESWTEGGSANVFAAPNFAVGAVLMMRLAAQAAPFFDTAEIIERHHTKKRDAPSGTSLRTASLMNDARGKPWQVTEGAARLLEGSRGGDVAGIRIHSLRVTGSVAHHEVVLGSEGETLSIRHDSLDRSSFMPGVLLAVRRVPALPGLTVGLEHLLDL
ncbi:MAG: 4-hydroxy-tetrahydrodipicolinate reductase [Actinomycetota bacterium]